MTEKAARVEKLSAKLASAKKNTENTVRLIAYHKKMLKIYRRKEAELQEKLEREKFADLYKAVRDKGCDISALNAAIKNGDFSAKTTPKEMDTETEKPTDVSAAAAVHENKSQEDKH